MNQIVVLCVGHQPAAHRHPHAAQAVQLSAACIRVCPVQSGRCGLRCGRSRGGRRRRAHERRSRACAHARVAAPQELPHRLPCLARRGRPRSQQRQAARPALAAQRDPNREHREQGRDRVQLYADARCHHQAVLQRKVRLLAPRRQHTRPEASTSRGPVQRPLHQGLSVSALGQVGWNWTQPDWRLETHPLRY